MPSNSSLKLFLSFALMFVSIYLDLVLDFENVCPSCSSLLLFRLILWVYVQCNSSRSLSEQTNKNPRKPKHRQGEINTCRGTSQVMDLKSVFPSLFIRQRYLVGERANQAPSQWKRTAYHGIHFPDVGLLVFLCFDTQKGTTKNTQEVKKKCFLIWTIDRTMCTIFGKCCLRQSDERTHTFKTRDVVNT